MPVGCEPMVQLGGRTLRRAAATARFSLVLRTCRVPLKANSHYQEDSDDIHHRGQKSEMIPLWGKQVNVAIKTSRYYCWRLYLTIRQTTTSNEAQISLAAPTLPPQVSKAEEQADVLGKTFQPDWWCLQFTCMRTKANVMQGRSIAPTLIPPSPVGKAEARRSLSSKGKGRILC